MKLISKIPNSQIKVNIDFNKDNILEAIDEVSFYATIYDGAVQLKNFRASRLVSKTVGEFNGKTGSIGGFDELGTRTPETSALKAKINPSGSLANCVNCAIEFQKKVMGRIYGEAKLTSGYGLTDSEVFESLANNFDNIKPLTSGGKVSDLSKTLSNKLVNNTNSSIIVGTLKNQTKFKAHAFNAIKDANGSWEYLDLQNGIKYNEKAMEKTFTNYKIYDVKGK
ncbi:hypothetical protein [Flavobacterium sp. 3HN19-14]|uniref:hypothetical protein n=1 Tax=Flavobacterium sp. 3HN19-14 TaxID=3448133 RepID=UPI003EE037D7